MQKREWTKYKANDSFGSRKPLDKIYHICHTRNALNISIDGNIKAGLVYDISKLNRERAWMEFSGKAALSPVGCSSEGVGTRRGSPVLSAIFPPHIKPF